MAIPLSPAAEMMWLLGSFKSHKVKVMFVEIRDSIHVFILKHGMARI